MERAKRLAQMRRGMEELERWLFDAVRQGLEQAAPTLDRTAARMVDAKLGGIARRIRGWKNLLDKEDGLERLFAEMAGLYLLVRAFQKADSLSDALAQDLLQIAGLNIKKEEVLQGPAVADRWTVVGATGGVEDNLRFRRVWLQGKSEDRYALLLDFAWGEHPFAQDWPLGMQFQGELVYYPSAYPQRALVKNVEEISEPVYRLKGLGALEELGRQYAQALSALPWLQRLPAAIDHAKALADEKGRWFLLDADRYCMPLACTDEMGDALRNLCREGQASVFGEWDGAAFAPLSCFSSGKFYTLG